MKPSKSRSPEKTLNSASVDPCGNVIDHFELLFLTAVSEVSPGDARVNRMHFANRSTD